MSIDKNPARWYLYYNKEKKGLSSSLDSPDIVNKDNKYEVWGPFRNSEIVDKWVEKKREISNNGTEI